MGDGVDLDNRMGLGDGVGLDDKMSLSDRRGLGSGLFEKGVQLNLAILAISITQVVYLSCGGGWILVTEPTGKLLEK